jgi:hypothetical protein
MMKRTQVTAKNLAIIRRMKMSLRTLFCLEHSLKAFPALQRIEILVGVSVSRATECLDYNAVPLREHARLSIGNLDNKKAFATLCAEHPRSQVMFVGVFFDLHKENPILKVSRPAWRIRVWLTCTVLDIRCPEAAKGM